MPIKEKTEKQKKIKKWTRENGHEDEMKYELDYYDFDVVSSTFGDDKKD